MGSGSEVRGQGPTGAHLQGVHQLLPSGDVGDVDGGAESVQHLHLLEDVPAAGRPDEQQLPALRGRLLQQHQQSLQHQVGEAGADGDVIWGRGRPLASAVEGRFSGASPNSRSMSSTTTQLSWDL